MPANDDLTHRPTEISMRCPNCSVPRFLAGASGGVAGRLRVPCTKCRKNTVFDLATGLPVEEQLVRREERELRCGACRWFLAGVIATASGEVRIPCTARHDPNCKRNNRFSVSPDRRRAAKVPVA